MASALLRIHGKFFSTLDELGADQTGDLRDPVGLWIDRSDMVLRDAKVHPGEVLADSAGAFSTRFACFATGNGLPLLP